MCDIKAARDTIDKIDKEMANLFEKRLRAVKDVFAYKKAHGLPIFDEDRERELFRKNMEYIEDPVLKEYYVNFLQNITGLSKRYQARLQNGIRVAFSGIKGAFAHIAAMKLYPDSEKKSYPDFSSAYKSVEDGECDIALLPIENSCAGEVGEVTDMIFRNVQSENQSESSCSAFRDTLRNQNGNKSPAGSETVRRISQKRGL